MASSSLTRSWHFRLCRCPSQVTRQFCIVHLLRLERTVRARNKSSGLPDRNLRWTSFFRESPDETNESSDCDVPQ